MYAAVEQECNADNLMICAVGDSHYAAQSAQMHVRQSIT